LVSVLDSFVIRPRQDVFLDFGSGLGRAVILAARKPFLRVIGVEMNEQLNERARENLRRALPRLECRNVELITCDATRFRIPGDVTVVYFFNPFCGQVLEQVLENLKASLQTSPRPISLMCRLPARSAFEDAMLRQSWLHQEREIFFDSETRYRIFRCP